MAKTNADRQRDYRKRAAAALRSARAPREKSLGDQLVDAVMKLPRKQRHAFMKVMAAMADDSREITALSENLAAISEEKVGLERTVKRQGMELERLGPERSQRERDDRARRQKALMVSSERN